MTTPDSNLVRIFLSYHGLVKGVALRHAPYPGLDEDIVQQVFTEFVAKADQWDLSGNVQALLTTMTKHVANRCWREEMKKVPDVLQNIAEHIRSLANEEELNALRSCLEKLPSKSRMLINMYYFDNISTREIANRLNMKADTVCRALCRLREKLKHSISLLLNENEGVTVDGY